MDTCFLGLAQQEARSRRTKTVPGIGSEGDDTSEVPIVIYQGKKGTNMSASSAVFSPWSHGLKVESS